MNKSEWKYRYLSQRIKELIDSLDLLYMPQEIGRETLEKLVTETEEACKNSKHDWAKVLTSNGDHFKCTKCYARGDEWEEANGMDVRHHSTLYNGPCPGDLNSGK